MKEDIPKNAKPAVQALAEGLDKMYDFRYNEVREVPEYTEKESSIYKGVDKYFINSIVVELKLQKVSCSYQEVELLLNSNTFDTYDPFKEYFDGLPKWNPEDQSEIQKLCNTVTTTNQPFFEECLRRWILALVASAADASAVNQQMLILTGKQGLGKSTWFNQLVPLRLKDYYYSGIVNPNNKDTAIHLSECLIINLDELSNLNRKQSGQLKEMITKSNINVRKAYGKRSKGFIRRSSFVGSTNEDLFLWDETGSRRFLCFEATTINYKHDVNMNLVYAEAKHLLENGEKYHFDRDDILKIEENNEAFKVKTIEERKIRAGAFKSKKSDEEKEGYVYEHKLRVHEIFYRLFQKEARRSDLVRLGKVLTKMEFESKKVNGDQHYIIYTKSK